VFQYFSRIEASGLEPLPLECHAAAKKALHILAIGGLNIAESRPKSRIV